MTSINLLDTYKVIWSHLRSSEVMRRQNYLYYKHAMLAVLFLWSLRDSDITYIIIRKKLLNGSQPIVVSMREIVNGINLHFLA